jgi:hypothetical protein
LMDHWMNAIRELVDGLLRLAFGYFSLPT